MGKWSNVVACRAKNAGPNRCLTCPAHTVILTLYPPRVGLQALELLQLEFFPRTSAEVEKFGRRRPCAPSAANIFTRDPIERKPHGTNGATFPPPGGQRPAAHPLAREAAWSALLLFSLCSNAGAMCESVANKMVFS